MDADPEHDDRGRVLAWLDGPRLAIWAFVLAMVVLSLFVLKVWVDENTTVRRLDSVVEERLQEAITADREAVVRCFSSAAQGPALRRVLLALELEAMSVGTRQALRDFRQLNLLNAPTVSECRQLAKRLNVPVPRSVRQ